MNAPLKLRMRFVQAFVDTRHGNVVARHYFRRPGFPRVPLPGLPYSPEFMAAYQAAMAGQDAPVVIGTSRSKPGTIAGLVAAFKETAAYAAVEQSTRASYDSYLESIREEHGHRGVADCKPADIEAIFKTKVEKHSIGTANKWLRMMRRLFALAVKNGMRADNPAERGHVDAVKVKRANVEDGIHPWTDDEVAAFEAVHPVGSLAHTAMTLLLCTAQRGGDGVLLGRQHLATVKVDGNAVRVIKIRQEKTDSWVHIPVHPKLAAVIDALPKTQLQFITAEHGGAMSKKTLRNRMREWCDAAGLPQCSAHGLRKAACRRLAEVGCTEDQIMSISGHADSRTLRLYIRNANKLKMAVAAMAKLVAGEVIEAAA